MNQKRFLEKLEKLVEETNLDHKRAKSDREWIFTLGQQQVLKKVVDLIKECV